MNTSQSKPEVISVVLSTNFVWGKTIADAMTLAQKMGELGWVIQGNPAPMTWNGSYGTGVAITRVVNVQE